MKRCGFVVAIVLGLPGTASAGFTVGTGATPSVAVDGNGTAHVAWLPPDPSGHTLMECEIPKGATGCSGTPKALSLPSGDAETFGTTGGPPQIFAAGPSTPGGPVAVFVVGSSGNGASSTENLWASSDGGASFSGPSAIGTLLAEDAVLDGETVLVGSHLASSSLASPGSNPPQIAAQDNPLAGPQNIAAATLEPSSFQTDTTETVIGQAGSSLAVAWNDAETNGGVYYSRLNAGVPITPAGVDNSANWTTTRLGDGGTDLGMAGGNGGLWLLEAIFAGGGYPGLREFSSAGPGPLIRADCGDINHFGAGLQDQWLYEDPSSGRLHLAYVGSDNGKKTLRYVALQMSSHGLAQSAPVTADSGGAYLSPRIAADSAGAGLVVWFTQFGDSSQVQAAWLPAPPALSGCRASTTRKVGGTKLTFRFQPGMACSIGQLGTGLAAGKGGKVTKVEYSIDGHHAKTVSKSGTVMLSLSGLKSGAHQLAVKVTVKHKTGTLKASFAVC